MNTNSHPHTSNRNLFWILILALCLAPVFLHAQEADSPAAASAPAASGTSLFDLIGQGGWAMYPLGLCSLAMFFLIFFGFQQTAPKRFIPANIPIISDKLRQRDLRESEQLLQASDSVLGRSLTAALAKADPHKADANKEKVEEAFVENLAAEESGLSTWINYLNVIATVSPMIGLLGTVAGMIGAFQTIGQGGMGKPELLANDIGMALVTTATGLIIGIPAMLFYFVLKARLGSRMVATAQAATLLVDHLAGTLRRDEG